MAEQAFPDRFLWGTATAAHQVEGNNTNSDWWEFEQRPGAIRTGERSGIACDAYNRYREDFRLLRRLRQSAHRMSVEWSRIEPVEGEFDRTQLRHYRDVVAEGREQGLTPMVTLHHFSSPLWFARRGGFAAAGSDTAFLPFVERVADELGDLVPLWCTINEPNIHAYHGYLIGAHAPGLRLGMRGMLRVLGNLRSAHELAYAALKRRWPDSQVGLAHNQMLFFPADPRRRRDRWAAAAAGAAMDRWPGPGRRLVEVVDATADFVGVNHYYGQEVAFDPSRPRDQFMRRSAPADATVGEFGLPMRPEWLRDAVLAVAGRRPGTPIYVTESGIATEDDSVRQEFLVANLLRLREAIDRGADVRGYFHWTSMDNFEWALGYSMRFGLIEVDRATMERRPKPSAHLYARIAQTNRVEALSGGPLDWR